MPLSETEKRGVSSGCRFGDKAGHVPIKKRRFLLRSPSPPPVQTSPCAEETVNHTGSQDVSNKLVPLQSSSSDINLSQIVDANNNIGAKKSDKSNERFCEDEDFSGISILAAAACSSSLGRDCGYADDGTGIEESSVLERAREVSTNIETRSSSKALSKEDVINSSEMSSGATSSCISTEPLAELVSISTTVNSSQKVATIGKGLKDASSGVDSLTFSSNVSCDEDENTVRTQRPSSRDDRLHWDLNVVMDAWEEPFDDPSAQNDFAHNISQDVGKSNHTDNIELEGHDMRDNLETAYAAERCLLPGEPRRLANQSSCEIKDKNDMDAHSNLKQSLCLGEKLLPSNSNLNLDVMKCMAENTKCGHQEETVIPTDGLVAAAPQTTQPTALCTILEAEDASVKSLNLNENCDGYQPVKEALKSNVGISSCQLQDLATIDAVSAETHIGLCVSSNSVSLKEVKQNIAFPELQETPKIFRHEVDSLVEDVDMKTVEPLKHAKFAISDNNSLPETEAPNSVSERSLMDGTDAAGELQEDYDSQYEDGELRESGGRVWEEYYAADREAENPGDYHVSEGSQVEDRKSGRMVMAPALSSHDSNIDQEVHGMVAEAVGNERGLEEGKQINLSHVVEKKEPTLGNELCGSSKNYSDMATQGADDNDLKSRKSTHFDGFLNSQSTETREDPKAIRRGLQSQIEAPVARDDTCRKEHLKKMENSFETGPIRSFERMRYPFHNQGRGRQCGSWDGPSDGRRSMRRHYSPIIHGNSKLDDDGVVERDDLGCDGTQDDVSYSQQLFPKNRAGAEGDPYAGFHSRYKADRKFSPDRAGGFGRGRPFRYGPFVEGRGGRGRFNGPSPDETFQSSLKYRRPLSRRERSISPFGGRGQSNIHPSRRKSPSQSRSRSPVWNSPRRRLGPGSGGNAFLGNRSRSPNFRSEARMQRLRSPHQQPGFGVDHTGGFRSISRNHGSPPRNRWSSARKDEQGQFRELGYKQRASALDRSPGRIRLRADRDSAIDSPRNLKPDGYYRISDRVPDDAGRVRYDGNFEGRRKPYNLFRPARRNYDDGIASRLRQDNNDSFSMPNSFRNRDASNFQDRDASNFQDRGIRSIDSRIGEGPRRFRGENHCFNYERDGKFNPKQFGVDAMDSSHNLKEEQYRPNYNGRFSNVNGGNRGCRYENYEDRRKHYTPTNMMRRSDNEDTEKILNQNQKFEDTPQFCSRVTRGFDGQIGSLSTIFREDEEPVVGGQQEKLDDNSESVVQNSGENDVTKGVITS